MKKIRCKNVGTTNKRVRKNKDKILEWVRDKTMEKVRSFFDGAEQGAHQGMSLPILVHLLFVMKKPTIGSVTAPQALPMNRTMEAWKALICRAEQGQTGVTNRNKTRTVFYPYMGVKQTNTQRHSHSLCHQIHYLSDIQQVDLQEERCGAGSHLLWSAANGETQLTA